MLRSLVTPLCLAAAVLATPAVGSAQVERFLGAWTLVEWTDVRNGEAVRPYGDNPTGQIVYTESGRMTAVLMPEPVEGELPRQFVAYWGGFSLQMDQGTVTHHVEGSYNSGMRGTDQVRSFRFEGTDRLVLSPGGQSLLTWERVR